MEQAVQRIHRYNITDKFEIVKTLMEAAERLSPDGAAKRQMVLEEYAKLVTATNQGEQRYSMISLASIELIIEALIFASKTVMDFNKTTGCWSKITGLWKK